MCLGHSKMSQNGRLALEEVYNISFSHGDLPVSWQTVHSFRGTVSHEESNEGRMVGRSVRATQPASFVRMPGRRTESGSSDSDLSGCALIADSSQCWFGAKPNRFRRSNRRQKASSEVQVIAPKLHTAEKGSDLFLVLAEFPVLLTKEFLSHNGFQARCCISMCDVMRKET